METTKPINHKTSALKFIANRINGDLSKYTNRSEAQSILAKCNGLSIVFDRLATSATLRSPLETPETHFIRVSNQANTLLAKWQKESDQLFEYYRNYWLRIESDILSLTGLNQKSKFADEIRASIKAMTSEQRTNKMIELVKTSDSNTLSAIYEAPSFLSGLADSEMNSHFNIYFGQHATELLKERKNLDDVLVSVTAFMRAYQSGLKSFMDSKKMREIQHQRERASRPCSERAFRCTK
jgi:hypothetical protein